MPPRRLIQVLCPSSVVRGLAAAAILLLLSISGMAQTSQPQPWPNTADEPLAFDYGASTGAQALIRSGDDILLRFIPDGHTIDVAPGAWLQANHVPQGFRLLAEPTPVAAWYDLPDIIAFDGSSASAVHTLGDNPDG